MATPAAVKEEEPATRFAKDQLKSIIERIERLEEEKKTISDDIRDVYAESKGNGFDVKALRTIIRLRKQDPNERQEQETILGLDAESRLGKYCDPPGFREDCTQFPRHGRAGFDRDRHLLAVEI